MNKCLVTIDTEADSSADWKRRGQLSFESVIYGIPLLLRPLWDRCGVNPIYFVSPEVALNDACCRVLQAEQKKGAVIGAHLHTEYLEFDPASPPPTGAEFASALSRDAEFDALSKLTNIIKARLGAAPQWYRAGRFGAGNNTAGILAELGYKYDSSVTPGIDWSPKGGPDFSAAPLQPYRISVNSICKPAGADDDSGITEYPVTICGKRFGMLGARLPDSWPFYNWLRPSHMTAFEQRRLVSAMRSQYTDPVLVMMFHSMEILPGKSPYVRGPITQRRFLSVLENVLNYINK